MFEAPWLIDERPVAMGRNHSQGGQKVGLVVGAKIEPSSLRCVPRGRGEEIRVYYPVLVVAELWPGIGKQNEEAVEGRLTRQVFQKQAGFSLQKVKVAEARAIALADSARDTVRGQIDADTKILGMRVGVGRQKMTVATAEFPDEFVFRPEDARKLFAKVAAAGRHDGMVVGGASGVVHVLEFNRRC